MPVTPKTLAREVTSLISFPAVATRINEMVDDGHSDAADIGRVVQQDPALTASLLRLANSSFYGFGSKVDNVGRAASRVGLVQVRDLALGICMKRAFDGIPNQIISVRDFWQHSLCCAIAGRGLAMELGLRNSEALFTAGLLHDIGHLVLFRMLPELSLEALTRSIDESDGKDLHVAEREVFGFDHAEVGGELASAWNLPGLLRECILWHHIPERASDHQTAVALIHIANSIAVLSELESDDFADGPAIDPAAWSLLEASPSIVPQIVTLIEDQFSDMQKLILND